MRNDIFYIACVMKYLNNSYTNTIEGFFEMFLIVQNFLYLLFCVHWRTCVSFAVTIVSQELF